MGRVVTFAELAGRVDRGVTTAPITAGDTKEMAAEFVRVDPGTAWIATVPSGSDCYLFAIAGDATISAGTEAQAFRPQTFATVAEDVTFSVRNEGTIAAEIVKVLAPPTPTGRLAGFKDKLAVAERANIAKVEIPDQKKKRIYFAGHQHGARTDRGHAMIVEYVEDTFTALHHHPNAESMFVPLDGALQFTVNGEQVVVAPGQAAYFPTGDKHGLHVAKGHTGASFLEFHIPAAFTTIKE